MTQVSIHHLTKTYPAGDGPALTDLSLEIACGEMVALLGPSGCGKTTALKLLAGLVAPDHGDVRFDDVPVLGQPAERRGAVMVFQNGLLFPYMTVAENVGFGLRMRKLPRAQIAARVDAMLEQVRLPGFGPRKPSELSGGQAQRVALARALILQPRVLLLDEPLSSLDAHLRGDMRDLIRRLQREAGITTIVVTHDQQEAVELADRIALLSQGRLLQFAPPEVFYQRPATLDVARFFGGTNFVPGRVQARQFYCAMGSLDLADPGPDGPATVTFRPEALRLVNPVRDQSGDNCLTARITTVTFLGTQTRLGLMSAATSFDMTLPPDQASALCVGTDVMVALPPAALWIIR